MDAKKVSFGFSKFTKKLNRLPVKPTTNNDNKVELIKCLEGQEIKLVEEKQVVAPLVIPVKENQITKTALASLNKRRAVLLGEDDETKAEQTISDTATTTVDANESLEKRAARELLNDLQTNEQTENGTNLVLPAVKADELPLDGAKESSLDDYESIPIQEFGKAMLRGMGWVDPPVKKGKTEIDEAPIVRPKGMGLGADKALKAKPSLIPPDPNEVLEIKKHAFVRILAGKYKDLYGQIEGFDDHAGRVIVKMAIGGVNEVFNEFLCQPVSKKEYAQYSKCINTTKYEKFKNMENEHGQIIVKKEEKSDRGPHKNEDRNSQYNSNKYVGNREQKFKVKDEKFKDEHKRDYKDEKKRDYKDEYKTGYKEEYKTSSKYYNDNRELHNSHVSSSRFREEQRQDDREKHRSRSRESSRRNRTSHSSTSHRRHSSPEQTPDTSVSSESDSDSSDSAYERRHRKPSSKKLKSKKKSKKSKSKSKQRHRSTSSDTEVSPSSPQERRRRTHSKKTKKSKKQRER